MISDNFREVYNFNHPHKSVGNKSEINNNYIPKFKISYKVEVYNLSLNYLKII